MIEIGTSPAWVNGGSLCFTVPQSWLSHNELEANDTVYVQHRIRQELRYFTSDGPGRQALRLRNRRTGSSSVILTIPKDAARDLGICEGVDLGLSMMAAGTLVVRRAHG